MGVQPCRPASTADGRDLNPPDANVAGRTAARAGRARFWMAYLAAQRQLPSNEGLLPDVRIFNGGGAPKPVTLHAEMMEAFGAPLIGGWGLTEAPINTMVHIDDPDHKKAATDGRPCPGTSLRVVMDDHECEPGVEGELRVKGPQVFIGYVDSSLDADAFEIRPVPNRRPGDRRDGSVDPGRLKDVISQGWNISAKGSRICCRTREISTSRSSGCPTMPASKGVCRVTTAGDTRSPSRDEEYLIRAKVAAQAPEQLELVDVLPRNPTGKVLKKDLRVQFGGES